MEREPIQKKPGLLELLDEWEKQGASDAEIHERTKRFLNMKAREQGVPLRGTFELTPLCNLDCKMCYVHLTAAQLRESGKKLLTTAQWIDLMQQAIDAGMIGALLTGGEAMMHPGFDELYLFLREKGIETYVKTNGLLLTKERVAFFKAHGLNGMTVTLYGGDDDTYEKVTGHRCYAKVTEGIERAKEAGLVIEISITPSRYMRENMETLLARIHGLGLPYKINSQLSQPRKDTGRSGEPHDLDLDDYIELYKIEAKLSGRVLTPICESGMWTNQRSLDRKSVV